MTPEEYIKKLNELKAKGERASVHQLKDIEQQIVDIIRDFVDEKIDTKDGKIVPNDKAKKALNDFSDTVTKAVTELSDYKGNVGQFLKNFKDIGSLMTEFQEGNGVNVKQARLGPVQEIVTNEIINRYSENGLNKHFVQPLRQLLYQNITSGTNKKEAMAKLKDYIASGQDKSGKLGRYLEQTAQQAVDSYTGAINTRIMQTFSIDTYIMSGSLIDTSSKQCKYAINELEGIIDRKDWPKLKTMAEQDGLIEGTTFDNLPINKLHWGCRHEFTPITLTEQQRAKLTETPTNRGGTPPAPTPRPTPPPTPKPAPPLVIRAPYKAAASVKEAETWAKDVLKVKFADFKGIHLDVANDINKAVYNIQTAMPNIRTNGIGSAQEANKQMKAKIIEEYKKSDWYQKIVKTFSQKAADLHAEQFARDQVPAVRAGVLAWSTNKSSVKIPGGKEIDTSEFVGVFVNANEAKSKVALDKIVQDNRDSKWFTESADDFGYIMVHEIGHEIDKTILFRETPGFQEVFKRERALGVEALSNKLSRYGATAGGNKKHLEHEMIAESWAEFMTNKKPRALAKEIGEMMLKSYYDYHVQGTGTTFNAWYEATLKSIKDVN